MVIVYCYECNKKISDNARSCPHCGAPQAAGDDSKEVNWVVCLIISFFLGALGLDRFMMGHIGFGFLKLFTFGFFGVWWFIDFLLILTKRVNGITFV